MKYLSQHLPAIKRQRVLVRCNFDVPMKHGQILDTTRIEDALTTIRQLRDQANSVILLAHAGRPEGYDLELSLEPIARELETLLCEPVQLMTYDPDITQVQPNVESSISILENLRFWTEEAEADQRFAKHLASWGDVYVNEAFANCHRDHSSMTLLPKYLESYAGIRLEQELRVLQTAVQDPKRPLLVIIGGAKLSTKEPLVFSFANWADQVLVGGKIAADLASKHASLPANVQLATLTENGRDISTESTESFVTQIMQAATVIWNGAVGVFEEAENQVGTRKIAEALNQTEAFTIVGGGDTEAALSLFNLETHINHISTGGGAMLQLLSEHELVAISALE